MGCGRWRNGFLAFWYEYDRWAGSPIRSIKKAGPKLTHESRYNAEKGTAMSSGLFFLLVPRLYIYSMTGTTCCAGTIDEWVKNHT